MKKKFLLVEDSPIVIQMSKRFLEDKGYEVITALDGISALEKAYEHQPDIILLDLVLPKLEGIQVCRILREHPFFLKTPILMFTSSRKTVHEYWAFVNQVDAYFIKPRGMDELQTTMDQIVNFIENKLSKKSSLKTPPIEIEDSIPYLANLLYEELVVKSLKNRLTEELGLIDEIGLLKKKSLHFLKNILGYHSYFMVIEDNKINTVNCYTPILEGSRELQEHLDVVEQKYFDLHQKKINYQLHCESYELSNELFKPSAFSEKYIVTYPLCFKSCGLASCPKLEKKQYKKCHQENESIGFLLIVSDSPLLSEMSSVMHVITKRFAAMFNDLFRKKKMEAMAPLKSYVELLQTLNSSTSMQSMLEDGLQEITTFSNSQVGLLFMWEEESEKLVPKSTSGLASSELLHQHFSLGEGLIGKVAEKKKHLILRENTGFLLEIDTGLGKIKTKGILLIPILFKENLLGVLALGSISFYGQNIIDHCLSMVDQFSIAIHNAQETKKAEESQHKSEFLANMSHELRTPINAVIGYTSLVLADLKDQLSPKHLENLLKSEQAARNLLQIINDILDYSKIEAGKMVLFLEECDLQEIVMDCQITAGGLSLHKDVELIWDLPPVIPLIQSDYTKLIQIFTNILSNAVKFTQKGSIVFRVKVVQEKNVVVVEIEDTGCGIPKEHLDLVFESFRQSDHFSKKHIEGTGLGLAITKKLTQMLNIQIQIQSEEKKGSTFTLLIPFYFKQNPEEKALIENKKADFFPEHLPENEKAILCLTSEKIFQDMTSHLNELSLKSYHLKNLEEYKKIDNKNSILVVEIENELSKDFLEILRSKEKDLVILCSSQKPEKEQLKEIRWLPFPIQKSQFFQSLLSLFQKEMDKILILDDNKESEILFQEILERSNFEVHSAVSKEDGLRIAQKELPKAILFNLELEKTKYLEWIDSFKKNALTATIPIIISSSAIHPTLQLEFLETQVEGYYQTPIEPEQFISKILAVILKRSLQNNHFFLEK